MATVSYNQDSPGRGGVGGPMRGGGSNKIATGTFAFDSSYPTGGESISGIWDLFKSVQSVYFFPTSGYSFQVDLSGKKVKAYRAGTSPQSILYTDADGAAAAGVAVYVHVDEVLEQGTALAHLEFVSPTNADGTGTLTNGGATYYIQDDDNAATAGVALYLDEDAALGSRLLANTGRDCYVMVSNGEFIKVTHNADPGTPGVQVYFDEDAATSYGRLLFVSPTNANGTGQTAANLSMRRADAAEEVADTTNLAALTAVPWMAIGRV